MRLRWIRLLGLGLLCWGIATPVHAATDVQSAQYEVQLTPAKDSSSISTGGAGDLGSGEAGNQASSGTTGSSNGQQPTTQTGSQGTTAAAKPTLTGRLPQLSEQQWVGFGSLIGIITLLLFWIWKLRRRDRTDQE
ncbi:hypothetical protein [Levilactobacillus spicheri]|uniref:Gram-positive cocci surface proteins LPxTG domain-containing protein n=1 Tax=Levilactobacillus spicheri TaxID=216463 RepID=A0ABQ0WQG1_9LACO|nr:hypothetical protein [Levilactobacillus spicheri]GEO67352.1 hypothetical protein LSP04_17710 [Levilactobacillus spicheri]